MELVYILADPYLILPSHKISPYRRSKVSVTPPTEKIMSTTSPPLNPSQTVEKIREIIVGRHLERLEFRVVRLETGNSAISQATPVTAHLEDRIYAHEAKLEALQHNVNRLADSAQSRETHEHRLAQYREETQRLAAQIQQIAALKSTEATPAPLQHLERKIGSWLSDWQSSFHGHLADRDQRLAQQLRGEVASLWENTESQLTRLESRLMDRDSIEERFRRIATAARALAECASPSAGSPSFSSR